MRRSNIIKLCTLGAAFMVSSYLALAIDNSENRTPLLFEQTNSMTDQMMNASRALAIERGMVNGLIQNPYTKNKAQLETVNAVRIESEMNIGKLEQSFKTIGVQESVAPLSEHVVLMENALKNVRQLRVKADNLLYSGWDDSTLKSSWFSSVSKLILASDLVTEDIINAVKNKLDAETLNSIKVKHSLWEALEYAGLIRGAINAKIAANSPISQEDYIALKKASNRVTAAWSNVFSHKNEFGAEFEQQLSEIQKVYFNSFENLQNQVIDSGLSNNKYPVKSEEWFSTATDAIEMIASAHKIITLYTAKRLHIESMTGGIKYWFYRALFMISLAASCLGLWLLYSGTRKQTASVN